MKSKGNNSTLKIVLIVSAIVLAVTGVVVAVCFFVRKNTKKARSVMIGKLDFNGDGQTDAVMLDTTGNGEVDTIILKDSYKFEK